VAVNCSSTSASLEFAAGTHAFVAVIGTVTPQFGSCVGPAALGFTITCDPAYVAVGALTAPGASGSVWDIYCEVYLPAIGCTALLWGSAAREYVSPIGLSPGRLILPAVGQNLSITSSPCPSILPVGSATLSGISGPVDYELDPASAPHPEIH